jgi:YHS domain-containing protein
MEYQGEGWKDATGLANAAYLKPRTDSECPVCRMAVDASAVNHSSYNGKTFYFCSSNCRSTFDASPNAYVNQG